MDRLVGFGARLPVFSLEMFPEEQPANRAIWVLLHCRTENSLVIRSDSMAAPSFFVMF